MLVADSDSHVLPGWAFFCRAVIDGGDLPLTASRESFQDTGSLDIVRERLGHVLMGELILVQAMQPDAYEEVIRLHSTGLKALALESEDMRDLLRSTMPFRSTLGDRTLDGLREKGEEVRYVTDPDVYAAMSDLAVHARTLVLDATGPHDAALIHAFDPAGELFREVTSSDVAEIADPQPYPDTAAAARLVARVAPVLGDAVTVEVGEVEPADRPVVWWPHESSDGGTTGDRSTLLLNARNDAVAALLAAPDDVDLTSAVRSLHVVGMLLAHAHPGADRLQGLADAVGGLVRDWVDCRRT